MTAATLTYVPADPLGVVTVSRLRLFTTADRTGTPTVDVGPAVAQPDGSWLFTLPDPEPVGTFYATTTVTYTDGSTRDDADDIVTLPIGAAAGPGDPIEPWVTLAELQADASLTAKTDEQLTDAAAVATGLLWALSGRQFHGVRQRTVHALAPACPCDGRQWRGALSDGFWGTVADLAAGGRWGWGCGCTVDVELPDRDARQVLTVTLYGVAVDPSGYRLDEGGQLVRIDGNSWPLTSNPATDALAITYLYGRPAPAGGRRAARLLAGAIARQDSTVCKLPQRLTSLTGDGVSVAFDDLKTLRQGGTGIPDVDLWIYTVNPAQHTRRPQVLSPDSPRFRTAAIR